MADKAQNVQDVFLNKIRKEKMTVTVFLVNGVKLQGVIVWFDNFCVLLRRDNHSQLVYKHAISTVMPGQPVQLFNAGSEDDGRSNGITRGFNRVSINIEIRIVGHSLIGSVSLLTTL